MSAKKLFLYFLISSLWIPTAYAENENGFFKNWGFLKNAYTIGALTASVSALAVYGMYRRFKKSTLTKSGPLQQKDPQLIQLNNNSNRELADSPIHATATAPSPQQSIMSATNNKDLGLEQSVTQMSLSCTNKNDVRIELDLSTAAIDEQHEEQHEKFTEPAGVEKIQPIQDTFNKIEIGSALNASIIKNEKPRIVYRGSEQGIYSVNAQVKNQTLVVRRENTKNHDLEQIEADIFIKNPIAEVHMHGAHSFATIDAQGTQFFKLDLVKHNAALVKNLDTKCIQVKTAPGSFASFQGKTLTFQHQPQLGAFIDMQLCTVSTYRTFIGTMFGRRMSHIRIPPPPKQVPQIDRHHVEHHDSDEEKCDDISIHGESPTPTNPSSPRGKYSPMTWGEQSPGLGSIVE